MRVISQSIFYALRSIGFPFLACAVVLGSALSAFAQEGVFAPAWDVRGTGPLPVHGVSSLWVREDRIVIGTIASPGDPNVLVLDGEGKLAAHYSVGQRWIENAFEFSEGGLMGALCAMSNGTAGDSPSVFLRGSETIDLQPSNGNIFHYGKHSNHLGIKMLSWDRGMVLTSGAVVTWHRSDNPRQAISAKLPGGEDSLGTVGAVLPNGDVVVAHASAFTENGTSQPNLHLIPFGERKPKWSRAALSELPAVELPERGLYGAPTLKDGRKNALEQWEEKVSAPLSVAVHASPDGSLERMASADYSGWERWVRSSATMRRTRVAVRFMPSAPAVTVLDAKGALVRRFEAAAFQEQAWLDLRFFPDGKRLVAWPHHWNSRGLGGSAFLPADPTARTIHLLDVESGGVRSLSMPGSIADVAILEGGVLLVSCWDGTLQRVDARKGVLLTHPIPVGGPALLGVSSLGVVAARSDGVIVAFDRALKEKWRLDLERVVPSVEKPWVAKATAVKICEGLWQIAGGRVESDLGGQRVVEAPDGLVLIEPHAGLSFEKEWAAMKAVGLDPMRVKFVLATHEHGDHSPGAYLWRLATGAKFVCSEEMAYTLQHHIPMNTGYGFHPPVPADILVKEDTELDLAGLKVRAIRAPGHTAGSMAWSFEKENKRWLAIGDLIMPRGPIGYPGSINFSAHDILASLRKLQTVNADFILPGHGPVAPPNEYLGEGIETGTRVGWGKIEPTNPDPRFRISQSNVLVVGWGFGAQTAAFGDFNGDGLPDIAIASPDPAVSLDKDPKGVTVRIFLNQGGRFSPSSERTIELPEVDAAMLKMVAADVNGDGIADLLVSGSGTVLLLSDSKQPDGFQHHSLGVSEAVHLIPGAEPATAPVGVLFSRRFGGIQEILKRSDGGLQVTEVKPGIGGPYVDARWVAKDLLVSSYGQLVRRGSSVPSLAQPGKGWHYFGVGDFNGDGRKDVVFTPSDIAMPASVYINTGDAARPYREQPDQFLPWPQSDKPARPLLRASLAVGDWNGDGIDDLFMAPGQGREVHIIPGSRSGLVGDKRQVIALEYSLHFETGLYVGDFNGDGKMDIAAFGYTATGVGVSGPPAAYIWCQP